MKTHFVRKVMLIYMRLLNPWFQECFIEVPSIYQTSFKNKVLGFYDDDNDYNWR